MCKATNCLHTASGSSHLHLCFHLQRQWHIEQRKTYVQEKLQGITYLMHNTYSFMAFQEFSTRLLLSSKCLCADRRISETEEPHWPRCSGCKLTCLKSYLDRKLHHLKYTSMIAQPNSTLCSTFWTQS